MSEETVNVRSNLTFTKVCSSCHRVLLHYGVAAALVGVEGRARLAKAQRFRFSCGGLGALDATLEAARSP